jgi:serine/threonine protein kinase
MAEEKQAQIQEFRPTQLLHFRIIETLGQGGNGTVFRAFDQKRAEIVALKTLRNPSEITLNRFKREFFALKNHQHAGIVRVYEGYFEHEPPFFSMEWIKGKTLSQVLDDMERNPLVFDTADRETFALRLGIEVCEILEHVHSFDEIHRDLKPDNLFVSLRGHDLLSDFKVKMVDFGLLKQVGEEPKAQDTQGGMIVGTVHYLSPEQARSQTLDARSDLYSLGVILYRILACRLPHEAADVVGYLFKTVFDPPRPLAETAPQVRSELAELVERLLNKNPAERPPTARALKSSLQQLLHPGEVAEAVDLSSEDLLDLFSSPLLVPSFTGQQMALSALQKASGQLSSLRIVSVQGGSGSGKSALLQAWRNRVSSGQEAFLHLEFREDHFAWGDPLGQMLDSLIQSLDRSRIQQLFKDIYPYLSGVSRMLSQHFDCRSVGSLDYLPPGRKLQMLALNIVKLVQRLASRGPVYMVLDDLHLAPERFFGWLTLFLEQIEGRQLMLVLSHDPEQAGQPYQRLLAHLAAYPGFSLVELPPFDREALRDLLASMLPSTAQLQFNASFLDRFLQRTQGNPFCAVELFSRLYEEKILVIRRGEIGVADAGLLDLPLSLDQTLLQRVSHLPEPCPNLLRTLAIFGHRVPLRWLQATLGWSEEHFHSTLHTLLNAGYVEEIAGIQHELRFKVDGVRKLLYQTIPREDRVLLHQRVARTLEPLLDREDTQAMEQLAYHHEQSGNRVRMIKYLYLAGCRCLEAQEHERALQLFGRCLDHLAEDKNSYTQNLVHLKVAEVHQQCHHYEQALASYAKVLDLPHLSRIEKFRVHRGRYQCHLAQDQVAQLYAEACEMDLIAPHLGPKARAESWLCMGEAAWLHLGQAQLLQHNLEKAKTLLPDLERLPILETRAQLLVNDVVSAAKRIRFLLRNEYEPRFELQTQFAAVRMAAGHLDKALAMLQQQTSHSLEQLPPVLMVLQTLLTYRLKRLLAPDHSADEYLQIARRYVQRFDLQHVACWVVLHEAEQCLWEGRNEQADELLRGLARPERRLEADWSVCLLMRARYEQAASPDRASLDHFRAMQVEPRTFLPLQIAWLLARTAESALPLNQESPLVLRSLRAANALCRSLGLQLYQQLLFEAQARLLHHLEQKEKAEESEAEAARLARAIFGERFPAPFGLAPPEHLKTPSDQGA